MVEVEGGLIKGEEKVATVYICVSGRWLYNGRLEMGDGMDWSTWMGVDVFGLLLPIRWRDHFEFLLSRVAVQILSFDVDTNIGYNRSSLSEAVLESIQPILSQPYLTVVPNGLRKRNQNRSPTADPGTHHPQFAEIRGRLPSLQYTARLPIPDSTVLMRILQAASTRH